MQSFLERRSVTLDTAQPGVRHIQELIRHKTTVAIQVLHNPNELVGVIRWQDVFYIALSQGDERPLTLINREAAAVIRPLS